MARQSLSKNGGETTDVIRLRVNKEDRELFTKAAKGNLSTWIRETLRRAANRAAKKG